MAGPFVPVPGVSLSRSIDDYPEGIIVPVDKPWRWTSADVVRKVKFAAIKHFSKKNLKVGHAGTLDPLATGVLLVCIGKATKLAEELQKHDKEYVATIVFGATTPSYDREKDPDRFFPVDGIDEAPVRKALEGLTGTYEQVAPLFSAKSTDGVRAYEIARKLFKRSSSAGDALGLQPRHDNDGGSVIDEAALSLLTRNKVTISEASLIRFGPLSDIPVSVIPSPSGASVSPSAGDALGLRPRHDSAASSRINVADVSALDLPAAVVRIRCSKGTYIRAFARDLGEALGSGAFLADLRRTSTGDFSSPIPIKDVLALWCQRGSIGVEGR